MKKLVQIKTSKDIKSLVTLAETKNLSSNVKGILDSLGRNKRLLRTLNKSGDILKGTFRKWAGAYLTIQEESIEIWLCNHSVLSYRDDYYATVAMNAMIDFKDIGVILTNPESVNITKLDYSILNLHEPSSMTKLGICWEELCKSLNLTSRDIKFSEWRPNESGWWIKFTVSKCVRK